jgi:NAD(P)-dependent dehydrogenase (short-subunit alcohol dehydrogenase family)
MHNNTIHPSLSTANKVILITGAFGLIGQTLAQSFIEQGALVVLGDNDASKMPPLAKEFAHRYPADRYQCIELDITRETSCSESIKTAVGQFGRLDVLINCAGIDAKFDRFGSQAVHHQSFENYPIELIRNSIDVNMTGTILITQYACRQMVKQKSGNIINVASTYSLVAPNQQLYNFGDDVTRYKPVDYVTSKSFIPNFTRYVATFYAGKNIRCNAIAPHGIANNHSEQFIKNFKTHSPIQRMCDRNELIGPFTFLASDASSYMTGVTLTVDGGWTAW